LQGCVPAQKEPAMKLNNDGTKEKLIRRLHRIEGQVQGVEKMLATERECHEILQQLVAIRSAVQGASLEFLQEVATECLLNPEMDERSKREQVLQEMMTLIGKV
jgi:CsoR family transcriptional regulator, copper-sensing transcriptional repressor